MLPSPARAEFLVEIAGLIAGQPALRVTKVAIDGVDGAGKTFFADELAPLLRKMGRDVIRASVDGFHQPRALRYRHGKTPETFFRDSYDYPKLKSFLLDPLGPDGDLQYRSAAFDHHADAPVESPLQIAKPGAILVFDGIFLHRPELAPYWDFSLFLDVDFSRSIPRGAQRGEGYGSPDVNAESNQRYIGGQKLYFAECEPKRRASLVVDNNDLAHPKIVGGRA